MRVGDVNEEKNFIRERMDEGFAAQLNLAGVTYRLRRLEVSFVHPTRPQ